MTDLETLQGILTKAGIRFTVDLEREEAPQVVSVCSLDGEHNLGYFGFVTDFFFDADGRLFAMGAWE